MNVRIACVVAVASALLASACSAQENLCATGNRLSVVRGELKDALIEDLRHEGVPVEVSEAGEVCYPPDKVDLVRGKLIALDLQQRPPNHITIAGGEFAERVFLRLEKAGIEYSHSEAGDKVVLVVAQEDVEKIREITYDVARDIARPNNK